MLQIQPIRHGVIRKYFQKFKWQRKKRELLFQILEESEEQVAEILGPTNEFVPYMEAIPEIRTFLAEVESREKATEARLLAEAQSTGAAVASTGDGKSEKQTQAIEEVAFDPEKFNPFDRQTSKREEQMEAIKPNQARKVLTTLKK